MQDEHDLSMFLKTDIPRNNFRLNKVQFISFISFNAYLQILRNTVFACDGLNFHLTMSNKEFVTLSIVISLLEIQANSLS